MQNYSRKGVFITYVMQVHTAYGPQELFNAVPRILKKLDEAFQCEIDQNCPPRVRVQYEEWKTTLEMGQQNGIASLCFVTRQLGCKSPNSSSRSAKVTLVTPISTVTVEDHYTALKAQNEEMHMTRSGPEACD